MSVNETDDFTELRLLLVRLVIGFIAVGLLVVLPFLLWLNVTPVDQREAILDVKDFLELRNQAIKSVTTSIQILATVFGGIAILFNVYYGAKRAKALEKNAIAATENAIAATKNAEIAEQGQITERFTKAIEQLGSDNISIRLGGIYALERIAEESKKEHWSEKYHWTIMEVLSAFVREQSPLKEDLNAQKTEDEQQPQKLHTDIQAALTVIGRRNTQREQEDQKLDLHNTDIAGADLSKAKLQEALFWKANLRKTVLIEARLEGARFMEANLQGAFLIEANLQQANLLNANLQQAGIRGANLREAQLWNANLQQANLMEADLQGADLSVANLQAASLVKANLKGTSLVEADLQQANLIEAHLQEANLGGANMQGASLYRANLRGAILTEAKHLELQQLKLARGDRTTSLPDELKDFKEEILAHWEQSE